MKQVYPQKRSEIIRVGKDVERREPLCTFGKNGNWYSHYGKRYGGSSKNLKIELPYDPAIPLLGVNMKKIFFRVSKRYLYSRVLCNRGSQPLGHGPVVVFGLLGTGLHSRR